MKYQVLLFGLGNIGLLYDLRLGSEYCLTHTRAFRDHPSFEIIGGFDPDPKRRALFTKHIQAPAFANLKESQIKEADIIVLALPLSARSQVFRETLKINPRLFLFEKPFASTLKDAKAILTKCASKGSAIFVNYIRRCEPSILELKKQIGKGRFGHFLSGHTFYSGGVLNTASHYIDLFCFLLGNPDGQGILRGEISKEGHEFDADFYLEQKGNRCYFSCLPPREYSLFSMELVFQKALIKIDDFGRHLTISYPEKDPDYPQYKRIRHHSQTIEGEMSRYQRNVVSHLATFLDGKTELLSSGKTALKTVEICSLLKESLLKNKGRKSHA